MFLFVNFEDKFFLQKSKIVMHSKAMRKDFFYAFLSFAKHETDFLPYSNIDSKKYSGSVLCGTRETNAELNAKLEFTKMTRNYSKYVTTVRKYLNISNIFKNNEL